MRDADQDDQVIKRLNIVIGLLLDAQGDAPGASDATKVKRLLAMGLAPSEVAAIANRPLNYVTATASAARKKKG
jgi:hypothetical protein